MAYKIIYRKRYFNRLFKLLNYLEKEWNINVAETFIKQLQFKLENLEKQPFVGLPSSILKNVRSISITKHNRIYYRIKNQKIEILNMYDTRINPKRNRYK